MKNLLDTLKEELKKAIEENRDEIAFNDKKYTITKVTLSKEDLDTPKKVLSKEEKVLLFPIFSFIDALEEESKKIVQGLKDITKEKEVRKELKNIEKLLEKELKKDNADKNESYKEEQNISYDKRKDDNETGEIKYIFYEEDGKLEKVPAENVNLYEKFMHDIYRKILFGGKKINFYFLREIIGHKDPKYKVAPAGASGDYKTPSKASTSSTQEKKESESPKQESGKEVGKSTKEKRKYTWDLKNIGNYKMSKEALCYVGITSLSHVAYASMLFPYVALGVGLGAAVGAYVAYKVGRKVYNAAKKVVKGFISWIRRKKKEKK